MIQIRAVGTESWLDRQFAKKLSARLARKLWARCQGHRGLFVTLTYDRNKYGDPLELYRAQSDEQHVPLFLRKVARYLGVDITGRWFCKLEFQKGGWVHFHLIILDVEKIPHDLATRLWGHGHVWLRRLNRRNVKYCTKYTVKAADVPAWLYAERPRAVKIIRVSPGFWGEVQVDGPRQDDDYDKYGPRVQRVPGVYKPIGERLFGQKPKWVARHDDGTFRRGFGDLATLLVTLISRGCGIMGRAGTWLQVDAEWSDVERCQGVAAAATPPPPLHSIRTGNPDGSSFLIPRWLDEWFRQDAIEGGAA